MCVWVRLYPQLAVNIICALDKGRSVERELPKKYRKSLRLPIIDRSVSILSIHYSSGIKVESLRIAFAVNPNGEKCLIQIQMLIDPAVDPAGVSQSIVFIGRNRRPG